MQLCMQCTCSVHAACVQCMRSVHEACTLQHLLGRGEGGGRDAPRRHQLLRELIHDQLVRLQDTLQCRGRRARPDQREGRLRHARLARELLVRVPLELRLPVHAHDEDRHLESVRAGAQARARAGARSRARSGARAGARAGAQTNPITQHPTLNTHHKAVTSYSRGSSEFSLRTAVANRSRCWPSAGDATSAFHGPRSAPCSSKSAALPTMPTRVSTIVS